MTGIKIDDFNLLNTWTVDIDGEKYKCGTSKYLIDGSTGRKYFNESEGVVRAKCVLLSLGTISIQPFIIIGNIVYRILKIITFAHFWMERKEKSYDFWGRLENLGGDLLRIVLSPITLIGLELASIGGWFFPYNFRKLYGSIERLSYGNGILAPCFQPEATRHAIGGDINQKNAW